MNLFYPLEVQFLDPQTRKSESGVLILGKMIAFGPISFFPPHEGFPGNMVINATWVEFDGGHKKFVNLTFSEFFTKFDNYFPKLTPFK